MNNTLNQEIERLENAKVKINNALISKEVSIPSNITLDSYDELINSIKVGTQSNEVTAKKANVLAGTTTITSDSNNAIVEGTMPNNGAVSPSALGAGGSYTIPAGYHNGSGKITFNPMKQYWVSQKVNGRDTFYDGSGNSTYCAYIEVNNLGFTPVAAGIEAANYYFITTGSDGTGNGRGYWPKAKNTNTISFTSSKVRLPLPYLTASSDMCYGFIIGY